MYMKYEVTINLVIKIWVSLTEIEKYRFGKYNSNPQKRSNRKNLKKVQRNIVLYFGTNGELNVCANLIFLIYFFNLRGGSSLFSFLVFICFRFPSISIFIISFYYSNFKFSNLFGFISINEIVHVYVVSIKNITAFFHVWIQAWLLH